MNENEQRAQQERLKREREQEFIQKKRLEKEEYERKQRDAENRRKKEEEIAIRQRREREIHLEVARKKKADAEQAWYNSQQKRLKEEEEKKRKENAAYSRKNAKENKNSGGCFVATAAFGDFDAPEVVFLRTFRDESLNQNVLGRGFVRAYYTFSPTLAGIIAKSALLRRITRNFLLQPIIFVLRLFNRK